MFIAFHLTGYGLGAFIHHPGKCITQEKTLSGVQTCNNCVVLKLISFLERFIRHNDTAKISSAAAGSAVKVKSQRVFMVESLLKKLCGLPYSLRSRLLSAYGAAVGCSNAAMS